MSAGSQHDEFKLTSAQPVLSACPRNPAAWPYASPLAGWRCRPGEDRGRLHTENQEKTDVGYASTNPHLVVGLHQPLVVGDVLHLVQEPAVDLGELVQLVHRVAVSQRRRQDEDALVRRRLQLLMDRS